MRSDIFVLTISMLAGACFSQTTEPAQPAIPASAIARWESDQPELKKAELANIPKLIARSEKKLRDVASFQAKTPEAAKGKRERLASERAEISALRARRNALLHDPSAASYGNLGELAMGTIGVADRLAEFRVVQVIDGSNMLVDYWSADTVENVMRRNGGEMSDDSTPISELPARAGFGMLLTIDTAKPVWLSGVSTNGLADGNWLPKSRTPLFVAGTRQFKTAAGSSRTVIYVVKFSSPATQPSSNVEAERNHP